MKVNISGGHLAGTIYLEGNFTICIKHLKNTHIKMFLASGFYYYQKTPKITKGEHYSHKKLKTKN